MPKVTPTLAETYLCTPIRMDTEDTYYIVGFKPNATKMTAHHMLIYGCEEPGDSSPTWNCGEMAVVEPGLESHPVCASGSQVIYAWAMDAPALHLPEGVGFRVGANTNIKYLVLQVHYASTDYIDPRGDDSGVVLQYTEQEQPMTAGVLLLGTGGSAPAHSTTYFETACQVQDPRTIHPFAFRTHTHSLGKEEILIKPERFITTSHVPSSLSQWRLLCIQRRRNDHNKRTTGPICPTKRLIALERTILKTGDISLSVYPPVYNTQASLSLTLS